MKINENNYDLKIQGKSMCAFSFATLHGISYNTLKKYSDNIFQDEGQVNLNFYKYLIIVETC